MSSRIFVHLFRLVQIESEDGKGEKTVSWELPLKQSVRTSAFFLGYSYGAIYLY